MSVGDHQWARSMRDALSDEDDEFRVPLEIEELQEQFEAGYSTTPHGCRVDFPATECEHGQKSWAAITGAQDEGEEEVPDVASG